MVNIILKPGLMQQTRDVDWMLVKCCSSVALFKGTFHSDDSYVFTGYPNTCWFQLHNTHNLKVTRK